MNKSFVTAAIAFPASNARRFCQSGVLVIGALAAFVLLPMPVGAAETAWTGELIGHDEIGRPIYRLPPINVTVDRKSALAAIEAEDKALAKRKAARHAAAKEKSQAVPAACDGCAPRVGR